MNFWARRAHLGSALRHRNFRLFFGGQLISLCGTWLQQVAMGWLVWQLTDSKLMLGMVSFASQVPMLFLAPLAGAIAEHWDRRRALLVTQTLSMLQALTLGVLTLTGTVQVEYVLALSLCMGIVNAFDLPIRQAFLTQMLDRREDLPNAIALNSSMVNGARLVGPAIAGLLIEFVGEAWCFLLNGLSYIAVLIALAAMRITRSISDHPKVPILEALHGGFRYAFGFTPIRDILMLLALVSITGMPLTVLMPVFASEVLEGNARTLGLLMSSSGIGALASALYLASRPTVLGLGKKVGLAGVGFGLGLVAFSFSRSIWVSMPILTVTGFCMMLQMAASNTLVQTLVDDDKRARVMGLYAMSFMGVAPIGSLLAGWIASNIGGPRTMLVNGIVCSLGASVFLWRLEGLREQVRPIYRKLGILPEINAAIETTAQINTPPQH